MNEDRGLKIPEAGDLREKARELSDRHGEHAAEYVRARIEASQTAGESADAKAWQQVLNLLS